MIEAICFNTALLEGAQEVFETMIFMDLEEAVESDSVLDPTNSLLGLITFKNNIEGCLTIRSSVPCARVIAGNMLGMDTPEEIAEISENEVCDAFGEVTNMVMGSIKSRIQTEVGEIAVSIPTVVCGTNLSNSLGESANKVLVKVSTEDEHVIEFSFLYRQGS